MKNVQLIILICIFFLGFMLLKIDSTPQNLNKKIDWKKIVKQRGIYYRNSIFDIEATKEYDLNQLLQYLKKSIIYAPSIELVKPKYIKKINVRVSSSSYLKEKYSAKKLHDNDINTTWAEGVKGFGFGEWIKFKYKAEVDLKRYDNHYHGPGVLIINPGFGKSERLFKENNRIKTLVLISISLAKKEAKRSHRKNSYVYQVLRLHFKDKNKYFAFEITDPFFDGRNVEYTFYIESVYPGSKYNDTCISEIIFCTY